eukprot:GCRY01009693.1.p1 GENE.GCRY01009693.1~~GCRY01009693.1.p1  ORF type:complete len:135 (+),score=14.10 GCRY01009693.1:267-671(+)
MDSLPPLSLVKESYEDLLEKLRLSTVIAYLRKLELNVSANNEPQQQKSCVLPIMCPVCRALLEESSWACPKCNTYVNKCVVCNRVVKGLFVWCPSCGCWGGHPHHLKEWFQTHTDCPGGCGHQCASGLLPNLGK